jgi:heme oxygenase
MTILREITNAKHREVEALPLIQKILTGGITKNEYICYLYELSFIYDTLETIAKQNGVWNGLEGMERTERIREDLKELRPNYSRELLSSTKQYIDYLHTVPTELFMAHIYVRHTGDMYGGKLMARVVPGSGKMYEFENRPTLIKKLNEKLTLDIGDEANLAFDHYIKIFSELYAIHDTPESACISERI